MVNDPPISLDWPALRPRQGRLRSARLQRFESGPEPTSRASTDSSGDFGCETAVTTATATAC